MCQRPQSLQNHSLLQNFRPGQDQGRGKVRDLPMGLVGGGGPLLQQSSRQAGLKAVGFLCLNWALLVWEEWGATRGAPDFVRGINFILGVGPQPATRLCKAISAIPLTLTLPANPRGSSFSLTPKESGEGLAADLFSRRSPLHSL